MARGRAKRGGGRQPLGDLRQDVNEGNVVTAAEEGLDGAGVRKNVVAADAAEEVERLSAARAELAETLIAEIQVEVRRRLEALVADMSVAVEELRKMYDEVMQSVPLEVLKMRQAEFNAKYGGSLSVYKSRQFAIGQEQTSAPAVTTSVTTTAAAAGAPVPEAAAAAKPPRRRGRPPKMPPPQPQPESVMPEMLVAPATAQRVTRSKASRQVPATPMATPMQVGTALRLGPDVGVSPMTARAPRPGELVLSANGSPLGVCTADGMVTPGPVSSTVRALMLNTPSAPATVTVQATVRRTRAAVRSATAVATTIQNRDACSPGPASSPNYNLTIKVGDSLLDLQSMRSTGLDESVNHVLRRMKNQIDQLLEEKRR